MTGDERGARLREAEQAGQDVAHIYDVDGYYNGSAGRWTVCGERMPDADSVDAKPVCLKCMELWVPVHERRGSR